MDSAQKTTCGRMFTSFEVRFQAYHKLPTASRFASEYSFNRIANAAESTRLQAPGFDISSPA
jgi:hypothetical protein